MALHVCNLCKNKRFSFLFKSKDLMYPLPGEYSLYRCDYCGLISLFPQPSDEELSKHYPSENYYSFETADDKAIIKKVYRAFGSDNSSILDKIMIYPLRLFVRSAKIIPNGKLLDIGCGSGTFLKTMSGFNMNCYGVEIGEFDKKYAETNKLKIFQGTLEDAEYPSNFFDVITMRHVLEHVRDPMTTLKEIYRVLKPGGTFILETPNSASLTHMLFKNNWMPYDVPRHLYNFSIKHLLSYAVKNKFKVKKVRTLGVSSFVPSIIYYLNKHRTSNYLHRTKNPLNLKPFKYIFHLASAPLNLIKAGDNAEITLTK